MVAIDGADSIGRKEIIAKNNPGPHQIELLFDREAPEVSEVIVYRCRHQKCITWVSSREQVYGI